MNGAFVAGIVLTVVGLAGYLAGLATPYPGRAFSVAAIMIGVTLAAIGTANGRAGDGP